MRDEEPIADGATRGTVEEQISETSSRPKRRLIDTQGQSRQNEDDAPKRQRVSRACDQCRSKKDKCDGVRPTCSTCTFLKRSCSYKSNPKKRGLPTGYIRTLELLWGAVFSTINGSEDVVRVLLRTVNIPGHIAAMNKEGENPDTFLSGWKNSTVLKEIERLLTAFEQSDGDPGTINLDDIGEITSRPVEAFNLPALKDAEWQVPEGMRQISDDSTVSNATPDPPSTDVARMRRSQERHYCDVATQTVSNGQPPGHLPSAAAMNSGNHLCSLSADRSLISGLSLPANAWHLFDIYFAYTHCWLPIIEKHDVLRTAFCYNEGNLDISYDSRGSGNHAAMWAILALTSFQDASASRNDETRGSHNYLLPDELYTLARNLIPSETGNFEIGHIQALLILTLVKLGQQDWTAAWILIGQAIRMSSVLALDQPGIAESEAVSGAKLNSRRKHVFLGCFVLETLLASQIGRLPELRKEHVTSVGFLDEDGLDEWHPWEEPSSLVSGRGSRESFRRWPLLALSTFNRLVSLCCILNDICHWKQDRNGTVSRLRVIGQDMDRWLAELPKTCHIDLRQGHYSPSLPHVLCLHIAYESICTAFYLHISQHRATDSVSLSELEKRLLTGSRCISMLQLYIKSYGVAVTSPVFILLLNLADCTKYVRDNPGVRASVSELGQSLTSLHTQLSRVWAGQTQPRQEMNSDSISVPAGFSGRAETSRYSDMTSSRRQTLAQNTGDRNYTTSLSENGSPVIISADSNNSPTWSRILSNFSDKQQSLETPCPSLVPESHVSQVSVQPSQRSSSINDHLRGANLSAPPNSLSRMMTPDPTFALHATDASYGQLVGNSNDSLNPLHVDLDGYGQRRPPIAPDLDALFDELASLDGGDK